MSLADTFLIPIKRLFVPKSALVTAAERGDLAKVQKLLKLGIDVNATDKGEESALWKAINGDHTEVVKILVQNGANVNSGSSFTLPCLVIQR